MESGEVERELEELETRIERLRALYEQYFMGIERLEPLIPRKDVERRVWVLRREQIRNTGLRFKMQMLIQRFNTFQQYWGRISREIDNGTYRRDVMRAAKRVGTQEALTIVGRKRAERYAMLAEEKEPAEAREASPRQEAGEDDDLDDEAITLAPPPGRIASPADLAEYVATVGRPAASVYVLNDDDDDAAIEDAPPARAPAPPLVAMAPPAMAQSAAPVKPAPLAGLPWGLGRSKPQPKPDGAAAAAAGPAVRSLVGQPAQPAAGGVPARSRVAELAEQMRANRAQGDASKAAASAAAAAGGAAPSGDPRAGERAPAPPLRPAPPAARIQPPAPQPSPPAAPQPAASATAGASSAVAPGDGGASKRRGSAHPDDPAPSRRRRSSLPPAGDPGAATGARHPSSRRSSRPPRPAEAPRAGADAAVRARAAAPAPRATARDEELPEQRMRQIYAKYVETKRSANESTAGVTYERLAESLREQAAKLRASNPARSIDYDVVVKNGKTMLKPIIR